MSELDTERKDYRECCLCGNWDMRISMCLVNKTMNPFGTCDKWVDLPKRGGKESTDKE